MIRGFFSLKQRIRMRANNAQNAMTSDDRCSCGRMASLCSSDMCCTPCLRERQLAAVNIVSARSIPTRSRKDSGIFRRASGNEAENLWKTPRNHPGTQRQYMYIKRKRVHHKICRELGMQQAPCAPAGSTRWPSAGLGWEYASRSYGHLLLCLP